MHHFVLFLIITTLISLQQISEIVMPVIGSPYVGLAIIAALTLWAMVVYERDPFRGFTQNVAVAYAILAIGFVMLASVFIELASNGSFTGFSLFVSHAATLCLVWVTAREFHGHVEKYLLFVTCAFVGVALVHGAVAILAFSGLAFGEIHPTGYLRLTGLPGNANALGGVLAPGIICALCLFFCYVRGVKRLFCLAAFLALAGTMVLTGSRGYLAAALAGCVAALGVRANTRMKMLQSVILAVVLLALGYATVVYLSDIGVLHARAASLESERYGRWVDAWTAYENATFLQQLVGHGNGFLSRRYAVADSNWIRVFVEYGVLGLAVIVLSVNYIYAEICYRFRGRTEVIMLTSGGMAYVFVASFLNDFIGFNATYTFLIYILSFGLILGSDHNSVWMRIQRELSGRRGRRGLLNGG